MLCISKYNYKKKLQISSVDFYIMVALVINQTSVIPTPIMIVGCGNKATNPCAIFTWFTITDILVIICSVMICGFRTYLAYVVFFGWILNSYCLFLVWGRAQEEFPFSDCTIITVTILGTLLILTCIGIL